MEVWLHAFANAGQVAPRARQAEAWGFHGLLVADSETLNADVWVEVALAAAATERLRIGPGVTNPATRHVTVTASAAASVQAESGGRCVVGVGRGDSALTRLGGDPVPVPVLEQFLAWLPALLAGDPVEIDGTAVSVRAATETQLPPPVDCAATGPRVIGAAARHADRITFTVGGEPERMRWAVGFARAEAARAGREPALGAYLNVAVDDDTSAACDLVRGSTAIFARFQAENSSRDGFSEATQSVIEQVGATYDDSKHGHSSAPHAQAMPDAFIERFAVVGPAAHVVERLQELAALGLDHVVVVPGSLDADPELRAAADERFARDVLPHL